MKHQRLVGIAFLYPLRQLRYILPYLDTRWTSDYGFKKRTFVIIKRFYCTVTTAGSPTGIQVNMPELSKY